jgi:hypothetical protein
VEENGSIIPGTQKIWVKTWGEWTDKFMKQPIN